MTHQSILKLGGSICAAALLCAGSAVGQTVEKFYKGRSITMVIGAGAGGGYDTYSRVLARHIGKHIPGEPHIVAQNMPGAGSIKAAGYLYNAAAKDGSIFGAVYNNLPLQQLVRKKRLKFDVTKLNWIGSIGKHQNICVSWHKSPIKSFDQARGEEVVIAATSATGNAAVFPKIFNQVLGTKFKIITGYKAKGARLAVQRGETQGICGMSYQTLLASDPEWILGKKINILAQIGLKPHPALAGVPMALDMMKNPADRELLTFLMLPQEMGRPYVAPPGVPADRLAALRAAFDATMKDPAFLAEAKRTRLKVEPINSGEMEQVIARLFKIPEATVKRASALLAKKKSKK